MARKRKPGPPPLLFTLARVGLTAALAVALVAGLVAVGFKAGSPIADRPRYVLKFADVECDAPPGVPRDVFLSEVRYAGGLDEAFPILDAAAAERVRAAFAAHPWVAEVTAAGPTPDRRFRVALRFRVPVLAVRVPGGVRLVDAGGVLLPPVPVPPGTAELAGDRPPPRAEAGRPWDDPVVPRAAALAKEFDAVRVEKVDKGWRVHRRGGPVLFVAW